MICDICVNGWDSIFMFSLVSSKFLAMRSISLYSVCSVNVKLLQLNKYETDPYVFASIKPKRRFFYKFCASLILGIFLFVSQIPIKIPVRVGMSKNIFSKR